MADEKKQTGAALVTVTLLRTGEGYSGDYLNSRSVLLELDSVNMVVLLSLFEAASMRDADRSRAVTKGVLETEIADMEERIKANQEDAPCASKAQ